jgi:hypothetical protein
MNADRAGRRVSPSVGVSVVGRGGPQGAGSVPTGYNLSDYTLIFIWSEAHERKKTSYTEYL